ncbi:hypothetical protein [Chryseobacterium rhizoplanae]
MEKLGWNKERLEEVGALEPMLMILEKWNSGFIR